jgi:hypothetical protein
LKMLACALMLHCSTLTLPPASHSFLGPRRSEQA